MTTLRKLENAHVGFWLMKDTSWCQHWTVLGLVCAVPMLLLSMKLVYDCRRDPEELVHAIATVLWICANIVWMIGEFYFDDGIRWATRPFFFLGILILVAYYTVTFLKRLTRQKVSRVSA